MPDETTADDERPAADPVGDITDDATTPGGYSYTVIDDGGEPVAADATRRSGGLNPLWLAIAAIVPAVVVGAIVWFVASGGGGSDTSRTQKDIANVVAAFSTGQGGAVTTRFEGELPPGIPTIPLYPGAKVVSSILQVTGNDASYLVIYDTKDAREKVASYYDEQFKTDPFQADAGQDSRDSTLHQFSKIDDPDITGLVLVSDAKNGDLTTILQSVQVASGAKNATKTPFLPPPSRTLPDGFPSNVPVYDGALLYQSAFQKQAAGSQYAVSYITKDAQADVMTFFRAKLADAKFTVTDGDASSSSLEGAQRIQFADTKNELTGILTTGTFGEDKNYTRIDIQTQHAKAQ